MTRRIVSILLIGLFLAFGSGLLSRLHNHAHELEDAAYAAATHESESHDNPAPHDESNCDWHFLLRAPLASVAWVPLLISLGLFVAFLTLLQSGLIPQRAPARIDCRGPPVR